MISAQAATDIVLEHLMSFDIEEVPFIEAIGRVLAEDITADNDLPPFDRVMRDGIAIRFEDFEKGLRYFEVVGLQAAGSPPLQVKDANQCVEIMTGAMLSEGVDTVIMYEEIEIKNGIAWIKTEKVKYRQNVHDRGLDRKEGAIIIPKGRLMSPVELGVAASVGKAQLKVYQQPKVAIVSTGDELVEVHEQPLPFQIRRSNVYTLAPLLSEFNIQPVLFHLDDDKEKVISSIKNMIENFDVICLSGGVSKGKLDFVPDALAANGVEKLFYKVKQRPGKPFWFGKAPNGTTIFALPGNPVSSFMCTNRYLLPWLRASYGLLPFDLPVAELTDNFVFKKTLQYFLQVKLSYNNKGKLLATPVVGNGSGDLANLADTDAFLELPAEKDEFKKGECYRVLRYR
jgi:molybdopterin molybdotransferase